MRKILLIVVLLFLCITILEISSTFGLFETNNSITVNNDIAKWQVKVNNSNINDSVHFVVDNYVVSTDSNVKEGLLAPGNGAYFDIEIDPNNTSVSVRYDISLDLSSLNNDSIQIVNIEELNDNNIIMTDESTYTGLIPISNSSIHQIRVYIEWVNNESNNQIDSTFGLDDNIHVNIPVTINFSQYLGEEIVEYT